MLDLNVLSVLHWGRISHKLNRITFRAHRRSIVKSVGNISFRTSIFAVPIAISYCNWLTLMKALCIKHCQNPPLFQKTYKFHNQKMFTYKNVHLENWLAQSPTLKHGARNTSCNLHTDKANKMRKELIKMLRVWSFLRQSRVKIK